LCAIALPASTTDKAIRVYVDAIEAPSADIQVGVSNGDSFTIENRSNNETLVVLNAQKRPLDPHGSTTVAPASIFDGQGAIWDTDPTYAQQHAVDVSNKPSTYLRWTIYLQGSTRTTRVSGHTDLLPRHEGTFIECTGAWATIIGTSVGLTLLYLLIFLGPPLVVVLFIVYVITRLRRGRASASAQVLSRRRRIATTTTTTTRTITAARKRWEAAVNHRNCTASPRLAADSGGWAAPGR